MRTFEWKIEPRNSLKELTGFYLYVEGTRSDLCLAFADLQDINEKFGEFLLNLRAKLTSHDIIDREQNKAVGGFIKYWIRNKSKWQNILIPLIRRIIPNMIAQDIIGVQPMAGPIGKIFSMRSATYTSQQGQAAQTP